MKHFVDHAFMRQWISSTVFFLLFSFSQGQDIAVGTWRTHFSYSDARIIEITPDKLFCATQNGLFSIEISTGVSSRLSKMDGLSDVGVATMKYDSTHHVLVVGYHSGFVDFIYEDQILTISDIATTNLNKEKTINDIAFSSSSTFLATEGFGVIAVNTVNATIDENFVQIGATGNEVNVLEILTLDDSLIIRTNEGIQSGDVSNNLLDFDQWNRYPSTSGYTNLTQIEGEIYALSSSNLMQLVSRNWEDTGIDLPPDADRLYGNDAELYTVSNGVIYQLTRGGFFEFSRIEAEEVNDLDFIGSTVILADGELGLVKEGNRLSPRGPLSDDFSNFRVIAGKVFGFHAPSPLTYDGSERQPSFSVFSEGNWEVRSIDGFINVSDVASVNGNLYYSSIGQGIYDEFNHEIITPGTASGSPPLIVSMAGGDVLWAASFGSSSSIHILDEEKTWRSFSRAQLFNNQFLTIDLSETGVAWLGTASSEAIVVIDEVENSIELIDRSSGLLSSYTDIEITVENNVWISTTNGPIFFPSASFSDQEAFRPTFENRVLFENEPIHAVVTDGGNNVWFGTENGIWVYDENISELIAIFNEENSPLPSNRIIQMEYNGRNGEVFILTDKGMISYRSASSIGSPVHHNVKIFPNPVRPDYEGVIGLTGLANNVNVKITDLNGNLIQEINASGGSTSWDLRNMRGGSVDTGIYLFFSSSTDGDETYVGKIAVIRG